ncbi:site-specific integrase [Vibrio lentus]|uniref:site-specific integrase n=1 Tax=Vibrio lentus TaxID=136468 RepID=UPI000C82EBD8|nr:site-specific integrase [Vibrio lentus]
MKTHKTVLIKRKSILGNIMKLSCFLNGIALFINNNFAHTFYRKKEDLFSVVIRQYKEDLRTDGYSEHSINTKISKVVQVIELTGKQKLGDITGTEARLAREQLKLLPSNMHKMSEFKGLDSTSIIQLNRSLNKPLQAPSTVQGKLHETSTFFKYLINNRIVQMNPFTSLKIGLFDQDSTPRKPLTDEQLSKLFDLKWFKTAHPKKNFQYWIPLLLRFSGARVNEIAQLTNSDIKQVEGIWCIAIHNDKPSNKLKTKNANRVVPIADALLQLGFLEFANSKEGRLFPEIPMYRGTYSGSVSKWAVYWRGKLGFGRGNDLHSLRHNFTSELKQGGVREDIASEIVGHCTEGFTYRVYGHSHLLEELHRCVNMIKTNHIENVAIFHSAIKVSQ